ncbi:Putative pentatricopeptide repeat-containing protein [Apostasia shenzhenica]|uniref:Pentatricopeptide repeat-containing protein n=1 Tax=Apostasia shenzhenica TaxID=1088818 RepID=A0A2I0AKC6_9ASPA|nr:Putative pentatricopeptide repeat-containing protein [Apostasia shenzhenica]
MVLLTSQRLLHSKAPSPILLKPPVLRSLKSFEGAFSCSITSVAHTMFDEMPQRDYKLLNAQVKFQGAQGQHLEVLSLFRRLQGIDLRPDRFAFAAAVKASGVLSIEALGKALHGFSVKAGYSVLLEVQKALIDMYARLKLLDDASQIFGNISRKDSVCWNVMLAGYARTKLYREAFEFFHEIHVNYVEMGCKLITDITVAIILPICAKLKTLEHGKSIHAYAIKTAMESETLVGNAFVSFYSKCGRVLGDSWAVFDMIYRKDDISWNSMISGLSENGFFEEAVSLFYHMVSANFMPSNATLVSVLPICSFLEDGWLCGKEIHAFALRNELDKEISFCNALLIHYLKVGDINLAEYLFQKMKRKDLVTWNTMISGYAMNGWAAEAMNLFHNLIKSGMNPDSVTLISILPCCGQLLDIKEGKKIHEYIMQNPSLRRETSLGNALVSFYGKCGNVDEAVRCFVGMAKKDLISWNAMLSAFADNEEWGKLVMLLNQMKNEQIRPDSITIAAILRASTFLGIMKIKETHGFSLRTGLISKSNIANGILDAYADKNTLLCGSLNRGDLENSERVFNHMLERDLTSWNLMLQIHTQSDSLDRAFALFRELQTKGERPNIVSITSILTACSRLAFLHLVKQCHGYIVRACLNDQHLQAAFLDAYSKCGSIKDSIKLFQAIANKDLITITAMIKAFAIHGMAEEALKTFSRMIESGEKPDHVILTSLLSACSHGGLIEEGRKYFNAIKFMHGIEPTMEHYACIVDLLARKGRVKDAYDFIKDMPCEANANVWGSLLGSCKIHGEVEIGRLAADHLFNVEGWNIGNYVVMSNIYAAGGRWDGVEKVRRVMKNKDMRKPAGCSWTEIDRKNHVFIATDLCHPQRNLIYSLLKSLDRQLKDPGLQLDGS